MRRPWWVGVVAILIGLSLMGFGTAISLLRDERSGSVILIVAGATVAIIGLLFTDWTSRSARLEVCTKEEDVQIEGSQGQPRVKHALPNKETEAEPKATAVPVGAPGSASDVVSPSPHVEAKREEPAEPLDLTDPETPGDVLIRTQARIPETDPTLGIYVRLQDVSSAPAHRLVVLGDSLSQGVQSLAMYRTDLSYPAMIAKELGCYDTFRHPETLRFGGLPLNLEYLVRDMELRHGREVNWWEQGTSAFYVDDLLAKIRDYWQDEPASVVWETAGIMHNLALPGADIRDIMTLTADMVRERLVRDECVRIRGSVCNGGLLLAHRILATARERDSRRALTAVEAAIKLGDQGGIETLIVFIGFGNALGSVLELQPNWSCDDFGDPIAKRQYNVWRPSHFEVELEELTTQVSNVAARHIIWATVPHVTILPIARGVDGKTRPDSRYFALYTRPWISEGSGNGSQPYLSAAQARAIDSAIDQYNDGIARKVREARNLGKDWLLLDVAGIFDRLAARRYGDDDAAPARPPWWKAYDLPEQVASRTPVPDSRFFAAGHERRGGLFSLDGVHPTTTGYAVLAQEFINVMVSVGVKFRDERPAIDFSRVIARDTLLSDPPRSITDDLEALAWAQAHLDWIGQLRRLL